MGVGKKSFNSGENLHYKGSLLGSMLEPFTFWENDPNRLMGTFLSEFAAVDSTNHSVEVCV